MPDQPPDAGNTPAPPATDKKPTGSPLGGLIIPGLLILAAGAVFAVFYFLNQKMPPDDPAKLLNGYLVNADKFANLTDEYKDADKDLVADTPTDATEPAELYFCDVPGASPDADEELWKAFLAHMSEKTGKPCKYLKRVDAAPPQPGAAPPTDATGEPIPQEDLGAVKSFGAQLGAMKTGKLHITAFTTGQVRQAVNTVGFRPLLTPADKTGAATYKVRVLVGANSKIQSLADLKGKTLAVSALSSNSGAKAPIVLLHEEGKLNPKTDYKIKVAGSYWGALAMVAKGDADATCIASDLYDRELARGEPTEAEQKQGRVKFTAEQFRDLPVKATTAYPKVCFGVSHTLPKELVKKIVIGFETFPFAATDLGKRYTPDGAVKFVPVEFKKDWEGVRKIDDDLVKILKGQ